MITIPKDTLTYINQQAAKRLQNDFRKRVEPRFFEIKNMMIAEFLAHPVTQEIQGGPDAFNISGTLGGYGNLFTFIGFEAGDKPVQPILDILESTRLINAGIDSQGVTNYRVIIPTSKDIFDVTDMPWATGRSWAKGIESGISGLGYYVNKAGGRSSMGIQSKNKTSSGRSKFKNTAYISSLINKYTLLFAKL